MSNKRKIHSHFITARGISRGYFYHNDWKSVNTTKSEQTTENKRDRFLVALYATEERSPKMKNSTQTTLPHFNFSVTAELNDVTSRLIILINEEINKANCMVRNSTKLDRRTKHHTQYGVSASTVPEIWPGQNRGGKNKKIEKKITKRIGW